VSFKLIVIKKNEQDDLVLKKRFKNKVHTLKNVCLHT